MMIEEVKKICTYYKLLISPCHGPYTILLKKKTQDVGEKMKLWQEKKIKRERQNGSLKKID